SALESEVNMNGQMYGSDVCVGGIATASYSEPGHPPSHAFDDNLGTRWGTWPDHPTGWIKYELPSAKVVAKYTITSQNFLTDETLRDWTFEGSNNNVNWTVLDRRTGQNGNIYFVQEKFDVPGWTPLEKRTFTFANTIAYKYYRINVSKNNGSPDAIGATEIEMIERLQVYTCPHCGATFSTQAELDAHIASVHPSVVYTCPHCGATFATQGELDAHIASLHPAAAEVPWYKRYAPYLITIIGGAIGVTVVYLSLKKRG
ncbi:unnamed protein product, partial [marine sediment metagenome]